MKAVIRVRVRAMENECWFLSPRLQTSNNRIDLFTSLRFVRKTIVKNLLYIKLYIFIYLRRTITEFGKRNNYSESGYDRNNKWRYFFTFISLVRAAQRTKNVQCANRIKKNHSLLNILIFSILHRDDMKNKATVEKDIRSDRKIMREKKLRSWEPFVCEKDRVCDVTPEAWSYSRRWSLKSPFCVRDTIAMRTSPFSRVALSFFTLQGEKGAKGDPGPMGLPVRIFSPDYTQHALNTRTHV